MKSFSPVLAILAAICVKTAICVEKQTFSHPAKRADDPSGGALETLLRQQAATLQFLQGKLAENQQKLVQYENEIQSHEASNAMLEIMIEKQAALIQSLQAKLDALGNTTHIDTVNTVTSCPNGWIEFNSSCYAFGDEEVSHGNALEICEWFGSTLAEVESEEENRFIAINAPHPDEVYWLGGADLFSEGHWVWVNSGRDIGGQQSPYTAWAVGRPNNVNNEDCLDTRRGQWNDDHCESDRYFVCEMRM